MVLGPFGPRRCRIVRRGGRCNRAPLHPRADGDDTRRCRVARRIAADCRRGGFGQAPSSFLEVAIADEPTPPFCFGPARHASPSLYLIAEMLSCRLAEPPSLEAESAPHLECAVLGSSRVQACCVAAWSQLRHSGPLGGSG